VKTEHGCLHPMKVHLQPSGKYWCLAVMLLLQSCSNNDDMLALQRYVDGVVNRPPGVIEPPPEFITYEPFTYSAANLRAPFDPPVDLSIAMQNQRANEVRPDENRPTEHLEGFALANLKMVGTLARQGQTWALIRDELGNVTRVAVGNYMGRNHGRIVAISPQQIDLVEIVPTGSNGWIERPQTVLVAE